MAQIIEQFESKKGRPPKYPWDEWADGKSRKLYKDSDFPAELISMRTMIHRKARDMGLNAFTHINEADQSIQVRFYDKDSE
jgi:hypothetical protein